VGREAGRQGHLRMVNTGSLFRNRKVCCGNTKQPYELVIVVAANRLLKGESTEWNDVGDATGSYGSASNERMETSQGVPPFTGRAPDKHSYMLLAFFFFSNTRKRALYCCVAMLLPAFIGDPRCP
jgi:hypothetical protein